MSLVACGDRFISTCISKDVTVDTSYRLFLCVVWTEDLPVYKITKPCLKNHKQMVHSKRLHEICY